MSNLSTKAAWVITRSSVRALGCHRAAHDPVPALLIPKRNRKSHTPLCSNHELIISRERVHHSIVAPARLDLSLLLLQRYLPTCSKTMEGRSHWGQLKPPGTL